jgi:hypothetical protein
MEFYSVAVIIGVAFVSEGCSRSGTLVDRKHDAAQEAPVASNLTPLEFPADSGSGNNDRGGVLLDEAALSLVLPERVGDFGAGPLQVESQYARREYTRGTTKISVTIAIPGATPLTYAEWVKMTASSPQVTLDIFPRLGSGFYDCAAQGTDELCHVHIHLRSGHHVEMMGRQSAHRADFDALLRHLPLSKLSRV